MKKTNNSKNSPAKKTTVNVKDAGELKKVSKLKPLKEKEKKGWKNNLDDEDDFTIEDDIKLNSSLDEEEDEEGGEFYDDGF